MPCSGSHRSERVSSFRDSTNGAKPTSGVGRSSTLESRRTASLDVGHSAVSSRRQFQQTHSTSCASEQRGTRYISARFATSRSTVVHAAHVVAATRSSSRREIVVASHASRSLRSRRGVAAECSCVFSRTADARTSAQRTRAASTPLGRMPAATFHLAANAACLHARRSLVSSTVTGARAHVLGNRLRSAAATASYTAFVSPASRIVFTD